MVCSVVLVLLWMIVCMLVLCSMFCVNRVCV